MTSQNQGTRLCVKNLPSYVSEDRLRELFSQKGEITDIKIMRKNGKSREFGFVGYRTEQEAKEAIKYFNNNCIDTRKITCEPAWKAGDTQIPPSWSLASRRKHQKMFVGSKPPKAGGVNADFFKRKSNDEYDNDHEYQEFLHVMQPRKKSKLWENDDPAPSSLDVSTKASNKKLNVLECKPADSLKEEFSQQIAVDGSSKEHRSKTSIRDEILKTGRLYVINLPYVASEDEVEKHFSKFGGISEVHLVVDKHTKGPTGRAFVQYLLPESAVRAFEMLNESSFQGRLLNIKPGEEKNTLVANNFIQPSLKTFKQLKNEKRKASESTGDTRGWNRLFMNPDTITENIARKFGVSKSDILDREASDVAVRIALGESEVIAETKRALSRVGVNVAMLELASGKTNGLKRSRVILVKNLPYCSCESELADMFGKSGNLDKVILPPTKTLALVIFLELADACKCFHELRYKCYKGKLLYLEFLPEDILSQAPLSESDSNNTVVTAELEHQVEATTDLDVDPDRVESRTLKVDNLSFQTSDDELRKHFTDNMTEGRVLSVRITENIARKFGVSKRDILDREASDVAVRIALGESEVIAETKRALSRVGVNVAMLELASGKTNGLKRSRVILVKNLPYCSCESELADMFGKSGNLDKVILPPTKTLALVIFLELADACKCFHELRYKCYKGKLLYLEFLPEDILSQAPLSESDLNNSVVTAELEHQLEATTDLDVDPDRVESRTLKVDNLSFQTSDDELRKHFTDNMTEGRVLSVRIIKNIKNGKKLSQGYGFIEFDSVNTAVRACKNMQRTNLGGHALKLQQCHAKNDESRYRDTDSERNSKKLVVKNVAFEATMKDLRDLFSPFGQCRCWPPQEDFRYAQVYLYCPWVTLVTLLKVKKVRLPKSYRNHYGYAFIEYAMKQEAADAIARLRGTHLYGRRLVLEKAVEDKSVEELRDREAQSLKKRALEDKSVKLRDGEAKLSKRKHR